MIQITSKSRYAVDALAELVNAGGTLGGEPVPIGEIAKRREIPVQFLEQLFATLRRSGILHSQRGVKGGYSLAIDPTEVTVLRVVEILDGQVGAEAKGGASVFEEGCAALRDVLAQTTIAAVAEQRTRQAGAQMYHI